MMGKERREGRERRVGRRRDWVRKGREKEGREGEERERKTLRTPCRKFLATPLCTAARRCGSVPFLR